MYLQLVFCGLEEHFMLEYRGMSDEDRVGWGLGLGE